jgi:CubicO group peptidase (beta-lactamase class C family)
MRVLRSLNGPLDETDPAERLITFEDLLTHRAGLTYGDLHRGPISQAYRLCPQGVYVPVDMFGGGIVTEGDYADERREERLVREAREAREREAATTPARDHRLRIAG